MPGSDGAVMAFDYTVPEDMVERVQIFTGDRTRDSRVAIWADAAGEPGSEISGDFSPATIGWQGVTSAKTSHYWPANRCGCPGRPTQDRSLDRREPSSTKWAWLGSSVWNGPFSETDKFRLLYCSD